MREDHIHPGVWQGEEKNMITKELLKCEMDKVQEEEKNANPEL